MLLYLKPEYLCLLSSAAIGLLIGLERAFHKKQASITTFSLICLGSCLLTIISTTVSKELSDTADPLRLTAQIVSGIGFCAGAVVFRQDTHIEGITTAAMLWLTAALGIVCGVGKLQLAFIVLGIHYVILFLSKRLHKIVDYLIIKH